MGKKPAAMDEGEADDPIAQSLAQRVKAGGVTAVVGGAKPKPATNPKPAETKPVAPSKKPEDTKKEEPKPT